MALDAKRNNMLKERAIELEFKINRLGVVGRAYYEASQIKLRRNRMLIRAARTTNMLLHSALELLQAKELAARKEASGLEGIRRQAKVLRAEFDAERAKSIQLQLQLQKQITDTRCAEMDCADVLDPNTPIMERIRLLDARLIRIFSRTKDTQLVEMNFQNLLKPMREEKEIFGSQLDSLGHIINMKTHQIMQLRMVVFDAGKSRLAAKKELEELMKLWYKGKREKVSEDLQSRMLREIRKIKMVMDVDSMKTMYTQFLFQDKQTVYLEQVNKDLHTSLSQLTNTAVVPKANQRKESLPIDAVHSLANHTKNSIRRVSELRSRKNSYPLLLIVEGTKKLVDKLHTGSDELSSRGFSSQQDVMVAVENRLIRLLTQLDKKMNYLKEMQEEKTDVPRKEMGFTRDDTPIPCPIRDHTQALYKEGHIEPDGIIRYTSAIFEKGFAEDDGSIRYAGHTKGIFEELRKEYEEREKEEVEKNKKRSSTPPKRLPY